MKKWLPFLVCMVILSYLVFVKARHTFNLFIVSFIIAYLMHPVMEYFERKIPHYRHARILAVLATFGAITAVAVPLVYFASPIVVGKWSAFLESIPGTVAELSAGIANIQNGIGGNNPTLAYLAEHLVDGDSVATLSGKAKGFFYGAAGSLAFNVLHFALSPIIVFFMLMYKESICESILRFFPEHSRPVLTGLGRDIESSLANFIHGQGILVAVVFVFTYIALHYLGIAHPFLNSLLAGLFTVIPYVGTMIAIVFPIAFGYMKYKTIGIVVKIIVVYLVIHCIEGYIVKPMIYKGSMSINPLVTIFTILLFGELMGFWGIILAVPVAGVVKILMEYLDAGKFASLMQH